MRSVYLFTDDADEPGRPIFDEAGEFILDEDGFRILADNTSTGAVANDPETAFADLVNNPHQIATRVDVLFDRATIVTDIPIAAGTVSLDRSAARLARLDVTVVDPDNLPLNSSDHLTPFGYELQAWRGIKIAGASLMCPLGVFPIQRTSAGAIQATGLISTMDRSQLVSDAKFTDAYQVAASTNYATAIEDLIANGVSGLEYLFPSTTFATPVLTFLPSTDRDPWESAQKMARAIGNEILFDGLGRCIMRAEPTYQDAPVGRIADELNLIDATVELDRTGAYNGVRAFGSNASLDDEYSAFVSDDDPTSPTYYEGPFGKKPREYASPFITSTTQAESAAAAILASELGVAQTTEAIVIPDPRIEPSDVLEVVNSRLEIDGLHIVEQARIGLTPESPMTIRFRTQQVAT